jgi:hypothetical protein
MTRRPTLDEMMLADAGAGISTKLTDLAFWLDHNDTDWELIRALEAIDKRDDVKPLVEWICRDKPDSTREFIVDLFKRYALKKSLYGRRRTPKYDLTDNEICKLLAVQSIKRRAPGVSVEAAIDAAAKLFGLDNSAVRDAYAGRGAIRRMRHRLPAR